MHGIPRLSRTPGMSQRSPLTPAGSTPATPDNGLHLPSPRLPAGPVPTQKSAHETLQHLARLHHHQVLCAADDGAMLRPPHLWLTGSCGCGKSYVAQSVARASGLPWIRVDLSRYAVAGQPGRALEWMLQELADQTHGPVFDEDGAGMVILEGVDRELHATGGDRARALQSELVSLLEGRDLPVRFGGRGTTVSSRRLLFLLPFTTASASVTRRPLGFGGTPQATPEPIAPGSQLLLDAGVHPSLLNVSGSLLHIPDLNLSDLGNLLLHADGGLAGTHRLFADEGLAIELTNDARDWIAREALALGRGGHGLLHVLSGLAPRLVAVLSSVPGFVATLRVNADFLAGRQPSPECIAGIRRPATARTGMATDAPTVHPDFPPEALPHRPTRPTHTGASSQGRLANLSDLNRWIQ